MQIDWKHVATAVAAFVIGLVLKALLDFKIAPFLVRRFYWIPVRSIFRQNPLDVSGFWEETWTAESDRYSETDRHSHPYIYQWGSYCYAEFIGQGRSYCVFAQIKGSYLCGDWYDLKDPHGYFGTFQLQIVDSTRMVGKYIGHSTSKAVVKVGDWEWRKRQA